MSRRGAYVKNKDKDKDKDQVLKENSCFYGQQVDGVAMGSPLAPVLASFFMGHYEELWLKNSTGPKVPYYRKKI